MSQNKARLYLGIAGVLIAVFSIIFFILLYSLAILDLANDGLMGPIVFIAFLIAFALTLILAVNRFVKSKQNQASEGQSP